MNKYYVFGLSMMLLASAGIASNASAQEKTRAEVRQELIQAENDGLRFITDTSYPEVNPIFAQQVARMKQKTSTVANAGDAVSSAAAQRAAQTTTDMAKIGSDSEACVGPVGFCMPYFGS